MLEKQAAVTLNGTPERLVSSVSLRMGRTHVSWRNRAWSQQATSLSPARALTDLAGELEGEIRQKTEPLHGLSGSAAIYGLARHRRVIRDAPHDQTFFGFWGKITVAGAMTSVFGSFNHGPLVFRRGPWEPWGIDLHPLSTCDDRVPIVFSPFCATLLHEAIGHAVEAEYLTQSPLQKTHGQGVSCPQLFVMDRPDLPDLPGTMSHDDVGNPASATTLIHRGHVVGDLDQDKGVMRRGSYRDFPKIRATNLVIKNGTSDPTTWIADLAESTYVCWIDSGKWHPGTQALDILTGPTYRLSHGAPVAFAPWLHLRFHTLDLLSRIIDVGNDLRWDPQVHWCVKQLQSVPISMTSPSILVDGRRGHG